MIRQFHWLLYDQSGVKGSLFNQPYPAANVRLKLKNNHNKLISQIKILFKRSNSC